MRKVMCNGVSPLVMKQSAKKWFVLGMVLMALGGCVGPIGSAPSWAPKTGASLGGEGLSWGFCMSDWKLRRYLIAQLHRHAPAVGRRVSLYVWGRQVLLVGVLGSHAQIDGVISILERYIKKDLIVNRLICAQKYKASVRLHDLWLEKRIEGGLLFSSVPSHNYQTVVFNGVAYVMGVAANAKERDLVLYIAQDTEGVHKVEDFVRVGAVPQCDRAHMVHDMQSMHEQQRELRTKGVSDADGIPASIPDAVRPTVEVVHMDDSDDPNGM